MNPRNFFGELKRRNVYKGAVAYAVVAWLLIQAASIILPTFEAPAWTMKLLIAALALGFPLAVVFAWAFELTPEGIVRADEVPPNESVTRGTGRKLTAIIVLVAVMAAGLLVFKWLRPIGMAHGRAKSPEIQTAEDVHKRPSDTVQPIDEKSIAVLPFENLSEDKANAFFASGIQDEILTSLAKISGLKVISRTSTAKYQTSPQNLPEIARALGVAHVLEGSVQRAGDKMHINVQLVRAATDAHIWAESYDRGLGDIFAVQAEVARSVAESLRATLSPEEKQRVETKPTQNAEAYVHYLRARDYQTRPSGLLEDLQTAEKYYTQAITLDEGFALAHARLAATLARIHLNYQPTAALKTRARNEAEEALRLQPQLGEGHLARGLCLYWTEKDYEGALRELEIATHLLPNDAEVESKIAYIHRRQGRWSEALSNLEHALARDPRNAAISRELANTYEAVRDWPAEANARAQATAVAPDQPMVRLEGSYVDFWRAGDLTPVSAALAEVPAGLDPDGAVTLWRWDAALLMRDFAAAEKAAADCKTETVLANFDTPVPKAYLLGGVALARGDSARAQSFFELALTSMETDMRSFESDPFRRVQLGILYAYLGRKEEALREGRRAVEGLPEARDALEGPKVAAGLALIYARTGETDQAIASIQRLLATPAPIAAAFEASITLADLRARWQWDSLRNDLRFQKILEGPEPKTVHK